MNAVVKLEKRDALLFADGSIDIKPEGWPIERTHEQRDEADVNAKPGEMTKIARVTVAIDEIVFDPETSPPADEICGGCDQPVSTEWTYCPYCGAQSRKRIRRAR